MKRLALLALSSVLLTACASLERQGASDSTGKAVRKTSNAAAVSRCEFVASLASGTFNTADQQIGLMVGSSDPRDFVAFIPPGGGVGELYRCGSASTTAATEVHATSSR